MNKKSFLLLLCIAFLALTLRLYNLNWDSYLHLHPDERAIVMYTMPLKIPSSMSEFLNPQSTWNPHFFAYGSFPLYLLKISSLIVYPLFPTSISYDGITILGRTLSSLFDIGTLIVLFFLARKLFGKTIGFLSSFFYSISVLPIQLSHFYAVDTALTFFILTTIYFLLLFYEKPTFKKAILIGIFFGLSLATKISASVLLSSILIALAADFALIFLKQPHKPKMWFPHIPKFLKRLFLYTFLIACSTGITYAILMPYTFLDFSEFQRQTIEQSRMTHDAFTFPYTLQYVGKIPYFYELKNIFYFGMGPILSIFSILGTFIFTFITLRNIKRKDDSKEIILLVFFWVYFLVIGNFAIGFMRYMLPLYPFLCLFASLAIYKLFVFSKRKIGELPTFITYCLLLIALLIWPFSFLSIYSKPTTRLVATQWILQNIPKGKTIAIEHWDDPLPMYGAENYTMQYLELYNYESEGKWKKINEQLKKSDYIIIASNRLYVPLQKLSSCSKYPGHCYPLSTKYYQDLFSERLGFKKISEFSSYPKVPILNIPIIDDSADESFTVYDHPKIFIFKK